MRRRTFVIGAVVIVGALVVIGALAGGGGPTTAEKDAGATLAGNVKSTLSGQDWYSALTLDGTGTPAISVADGSGGQAIVTFSAAARMDHAPAAMTACQAIAALAHDPNTAAALPISSVVISANGDNAAQCYPTP